MSTTPVLALPNYSIPFIMKTDASSRGYGTVLMQDQRKVVAKLHGFKYVIQYKQGSKNLVADALSRVDHVGASVHYISMIQPSWMAEAQSRMKKYADLGRTERSFQQGDLVYLKLQPYRQNSISLRKNLKLAFKYYEPFEILEKIGSIAHKLKLPDSSIIHPVFHVSLFILWPVELI
ncbi:hypothetical protein LIER_07669 [Lithospermum erythrorhizon]|uniref:Polyprotein n=1 Tax=Lithospermum erythrorhizon TaxID=34254 RepID=A0AAV3P8W0_LITER